MLKSGIFSFATAVLALSLAPSAPAQQANETESPAETARQNDPPLTAREKHLLDRIDKLEKRLAALEAKTDTKGEVASPKSPIDSGSSPPVVLASRSADAISLPAAEARSPELPPLASPHPPKATPPGTGVAPIGQIRKSVEVKKSAEEEKPTLSVRPYGRVELDVTYSDRGTNPLDPRQFNGYATAAGPEPRSSSTFNPRFSILGIVGDLKKGDQNLQVRVETDFYSTDQANLITPRLRLAYIQYRRHGTQATFGMDWVPVASLLPDILDFSIMGYTGNLWQRIPQVTVRQEFGQRWEVLGTVMRFERGFTLQPKPFVSDPFTDPVRMPYLGTRVAYQKWGEGNAGLFAISAAYRRFEHPVTLRTVKSGLINAEWVVPLSPLVRSLRWSGKLGHGQGLGDEFFRFGQAFNGDRAIRTTVGWTQLGYYGLPRWAFAAGWGDDDPNDRDLSGISNNNLNYRRNQHLFVNVVHDLFENFKLGVEYQHLRTDWTNGDRFNGNQFMAAFFYSF